MQDEQIHFRFFKNLTADQRLAVFKAFGVCPDDCVETLNHMIERRLLDAILQRNVATSVSVGRWAEAVFHKEIKKFLPKKEQGYVMGAFRFACAAGAKKGKERPAQHAPQAS